MAVEVRLLTVGVGSKMTKQQEFDEKGPKFNEDGTPSLIDVLELAFVDPQSQTTYVIPLTQVGIDAVLSALKPPSSLVIAKPGMVPGL